jgi:gliding motility-associated protein GldM
MGGAKNCPETPRQKMIGMMYLVLTAMLALNVSAAILNGYMQVDDSLHTTTVSVQEANKLLYQKFDAAMADNPDKTREWYEKAQQVREKSDEIFNYVQFCKDSLIYLTGQASKKDENNNDVLFYKGATVRQMKKADDTNEPQRFGIDLGYGDSIRNRVIAYRDFLNEITGGEKRDELYRTFYVDSVAGAEKGSVVSWQQGMFHEMPACAVITMLSKIQNDIRTEEGNIVSWLENQTDAGDVRVNKLMAYVIPESKTVIQGSEYQAQIVMAAIDTTKVPEIYVEGRKLDRDGKFKAIASAKGVRKYTGELVYTDPSGEKVSIPFQSEYNVEEPSVTISNDDLDIMYRDYENKFDISAPGITSDRLRVEVTGADYTRNGKYWVMKPKESAKTVKVVVKADLNGKITTLGEKDYRVKKLPDPSAFFVTKKGTALRKGSISIGELTADGAKLEASYGEDGILKVNFQIASFSVQIGKQTIPSESERMNSKQVSAIKNMRRGDILFIHTIFIKTPTGKVVPMDGNLMFTIS